MSSSGPEPNTVFVVPPKVTSPQPPPPPPYSCNQPQVHLSPGYQTQMILPYEQEHTIQKIWKEGKVLGAIQIMIGLIHIALGGVLLTMTTWGYLSISLLGGYPFWGGISFLISGSLSVAAQKTPVSLCKINGSLGMNIVSAIFSVVGIILFIIEISMYGNYYGPFDHNQYYYYYRVSIGKGIASILLLFSILEFVITCISSQAGCRMVCSQTNQVAIIANVSPAQIVHPVIIPQQEVNPAFYSNAGLSQQ
ncbi:membrane-spanning 4-domains subfamily A member 8-like [Notamacropus eugenii]|uniref:membrane-spanning 4-domains subfamily A member 8-like n=1 Tax=Notamacropus eugenii TaxID=9315 RepID=UPI003B67225E